MIKKCLMGCSFAFLLLMTGCETRHSVKVEPVEIKPIHITIDVNVKIEKALDDFFGDVDKAAEKIEPAVAPETSQPKND